MYTGLERNRVCASVVKYVLDGVDTFAFEMAPTDPLQLDGADAVRKAFDRVQELMGFVTLEFRATSHAQLANVGLDSHPLHSILQVDTNALWDSVVYAPVVRGNARGTLRVIGGTSTYQVGDLTLFDIVSFAESIPNDIPPVAGVILTDPLPPLCHVALLCQNRHTPCAYIRKAELSKLTAHDGKSVSLELKLAGWSLERTSGLKPGWKAPTTRPEFKVLLPLRKPSAPFALYGFDGAKAVSIIGAKAYQCHRLDTAVHQQEFKKRSFVLPMGAYMAHTDESKTKEAIRDFCKKWQNVPIAKCPSPSTYMTFIRPSSTAAKNGLLQIKSATILPRSRRRLESIQWINPS